MVKQHICAGDLGFNPGLVKSDIAANSCNVSLKQCSSSANRQMDPASRYTLDASVKYHEYNQDLISDKYSRSMYISFINQCINEESTIDDCNIMLLKFAY